jgi:AcrR family transcriptional regulator
MSPSSENSDSRIVNIDGRDRRPWALQTRDSILNAAVEEIAERGFERARLVDIAKRAGVTVGSIYNWYRDKADLFTAALDHAIEEQRVHNDDLLRQLPNHGDSLWVWKIAAMVPRNSSDSGPSTTQRLLVEAVYAAWQNEEARATILPRLSSLLSQYREVVKEGRDAGEILPDYDTELLAFMFMALPIGLSALNLAGFERPRDLHWIAIYDAFKRALKATPEVYFNADPEAEK